MQEHGRQGGRIAEQAEQQVIGGDFAVGGFVRGVLGRHDRAARPRVKRPKPCSGSRVVGSARGTNRFWAACLVTPMLLPMWVQDAPERRAWSTKCPIKWSATSPRCSPARTASAS